MTKSSDAICDLFTAQASSPYSSKGTHFVVKDCQYYFSFEMPSCLINNKFDKFILRYNCIENIFCNYCCVIIILATCYYYFLPLLMLYVCIYVCVVYFFF